MTRDPRHDVIRKGASIVMARPDLEVQYEQVDYALINYLLLRSYNEPPGSIHRIPVRDAMEYLRIDRSSKLRASLERLGKGWITLEYWDASLGEGRYFTAHYLSSDVSMSENGTLVYAFDPLILPFLYDPEVYSIISVDRIRDLKSPVSQKLYEITALNYRKKHPVWDAKLDELREIFQTGDKYPRFDNFRHNVIEKAVREVNAVAEFDVLVDYVRGGRGGAVTNVRFRVVSKSHMKLIEAAAVKSAGSGKRTKVDAHTVDILDGLTWEERGGPAQVTSAAIEKAREIMPEDGDLNQMVAEWRESIRGLTLRDPDAHFLAWLTIKMKQDDDPLLRDIEDDVFGSLLGDKG